MRPPAIILMYHALEKAGSAAPRPGGGPYRLDAGKFRSHLDGLKRLDRRVAALREWISDPDAASAAVGEGSRPWVLITFDDGDISNFTDALPILQGAGLKATFFVTVGRIGESGFLDWAQIRSLHGAGMEIGSHTMTHRAPALLSERDLRYEVAESKKRLEDGLGSEILSLSSPTGFFNRRMGAIARDSGYRALCCGRIGVAGPRSDPFALPRIPIKRFITSRQFDRIIGPSRVHLAQLRVRQMVRNGLKRSLGHDAYLRWRRRVLRIMSRG